MSAAATLPAELAWMAAVPEGAACPPLPPDALARLTAEQEALRTLLDVDASPGEWRAEKAPLPDVEVWSREAPGRSLRMFRARGRLPASPANAARALVEQAMRIQWDTSYAGSADLVVYDGSGCPPPAPRVRRTTVQHFWLKPVPGISQRDFVAFQMLDADPATGFFIAAGSVTTHPAAPERRGFVRGEVLPGSGWMLQPVPGEPNACTYTHISFVDLKGW